ncbi:hypothetical protein RBB50_001718 [Rhinocladiella similis]
MRVSAFTFGKLLPLAYLLASIQKAAADCSPTAAGTYTLRVSGIIDNQNQYGEGGQCSWENAYIYDNNCKQIGHLARYPIPAGAAVTSELPYTVVLNPLNSAGDYNYMGMSYGSYHWEGYPACKIDGTFDGQPINWCLHTFPCG